MGLMLLTHPVLAQTGQEIASEVIRQTSGRSDSTFLGTLFLIAAVIAMVGLGFGIYKAAGWIGNHMLLPLRDRIVKHFDELHAHIQRLEQRADKYESKQDERSRSTEEALDRNSSAIKSLESTLQRLKCMGGLE